MFYSEETISLKTKQCSLKRSGRKNSPFTSRRLLITSRRNQAVDIVKSSQLQIRNQLLLQLQTHALHILKRSSLFVRATRTEDQVNNTLLLSNSLVRAENVWVEWTRLIPPWKRASLSERDRSIDPHNKPIFSYERGSNWPCALQASLYIFCVYVCVFAGVFVCVEWANFR